MTTFFLTKFLSKSLWASKSLKNLDKRMQMIDILLKYILWYKSPNDLDDQWFWQKNCHKKLVKKNHSYLKYALVLYYNPSIQINNLVLSRTLNNIPSLKGENNIRIILMFSSFTRTFLRFLFVKSRGNPSFSNIICALELFKFYRFWICNGQKVDQ